MKVQILVSTMHQTDYSLVKKMNIFTDTIVINQCENTAYTSFEYNGHLVEWYDCEERGVGKSRNRALMAATADICLFADDDMIYENDALGKIERGFNKYKDAALIVFNVQMGNNTDLHIKNEHRLNQINAYKYGAVNCAIRRKKILESRIFYSLLFGGGAEYSCGEDTLFIADCLKNKLHLYAIPDLIGLNEIGDSTWFNGYTKKYFYDKGVLYKSMTPRLAILYCIRFVLLHKDMFIAEVSIKQALEWMLEGVKNEY